MKLKPLLLLLFLLSLVHSSCKNNRKKEVVIDKSITPATSFNNLFLDSNQINQFLDQHPEYSKYKDQYSDFYKHRNYEYAWFDTSGLGEQAANFMNLLNATVAELNDSSLYNKKLANLYNSYVKDSTKHEKHLPVQTELYLTGQFFAYAAKMYNGSDIDATELGWFIPRKKIDFTSLLDSVIVNGGKAEYRYLPLNKQYTQLLDALSKYNSLKEKYSWDSIAASKKSYKIKDSSLAVQQVKQRLYLLGDLTDADTTMRFDSALYAAVRSYQDRLGLKVTGSVDSKTIHELNVPLSERIKQILINLERTRWMPGESDSNYILVNIPEYRLYVYDSGKYQFGMNVIVGKEGTSTVIFTGELKYVVFSPYWNIPSSIVKKEIIPGMNRNRNYIANHNMEITGYNQGEPVVRQKPGPDNSLGLVKFLFPNNYNIYLHDTPNHDLFSQNSRSFSHGCIRIQDPKKMALYLLRNDTTYTPPKVDSLMHLDKEKWVVLQKPVRVLITYFTVWVDQDEKLNFRKDIYGHDAKMEEKLFVNN